MTERMRVEIPTDLPGWNYESTLHRDLAEVLAHSDCSWLQTVIHLGFAVGCMLATEPDAALRATVMKILVAQLQKAAESGLPPGEIMQ